MKMIPRITYTEVKNGLSERQIANIRMTGTVIVAGAVPKEVSASSLTVYGHLYQIYTFTRKPLHGRSQSETMSLLIRVVYGVCIGQPDRLSLKLTLVNLQAFLQITSKFSTSTTHPP